MADLSEEIKHIFTLPLCDSKPATLFSKKQRGKARAHCWETSLCQEMLCQQPTSFQPAVQRKRIKGGIGFLRITLVSGKKLSFCQVKKIQSHSLLTTWVWVLDVLSRSRTCSAYPPVQPCQVNPPSENLCPCKETSSPEREESLPAFERMDPTWIQPADTQRCHILHQQTSKVLEPNLSQENNTDYWVLTQCTLDF